MARRETPQTGRTCESCARSLEGAELIIALEDSVIGESGFIPNPELNSILLFCSDDCFLSYEIHNDLRSHRADQADSGRRIAIYEEGLRCDRCSAALLYGTRAVRVFDTTIDTLATLERTELNDASLFCSKCCADESSLWFTQKSITDFWEDVRKRMAESDSRLP